MNNSNYCFICQKNFSSSSEFIIHIRSHFTNDKLGIGNLIGEEMSPADLFNRALQEMTSDELWT